MDSALDLTGKRIAALIALGLVAGLFSGLFGVGGVLIVVPALGVLLKIDHKLAVGTSLMAIVPACTVGIISYAVTDSVNWTAG
ncbi:MAG: sulfite exporter TauE/SafE family protein, partial [Propionibacteriaceae bacterium]|nr:sulfite exporter TauE/SafE family protein [Propionibacteriaceae bacterium]